MIGFNTPSKRKTERSQKAVAKTQAVTLSGDENSIKLETISRLSQIGDLICGDKFQQLPQQHRQQMLMDFAYYSKVIDTL
jgi:hypothetical protein